ncbi:antitoxin Xre/MbcA/ParS toxin-binding domain-containing protein [Zoogloea sp. LCSB751]
MVNDSRDPKDFDAARWVGEWLEPPAPALGGGRPAEYMDTLTG